jgi:hypothetical protein
MYVRLAAATARYPQLAASAFDMFALAKAGAWHKCVVAAAELAASFHDLEAQLVAADDSDAAPTSAAPPLKIALAEVVQVCVCVWRGGACAHHLYAVRIRSS